MVNFALRVDVLGTFVAFLAAYSAWLGSNADAYVVVREMADEPGDHTHAFFTSSKNIKTLRASLVRALSCSGNGQYSLKECDGNYQDYLRYMMKGNEMDDLPDVVLKHGLDYDDTWIVRNHYEYWGQNELLVANATKRGELRAGNMVEKLEAAAKKQKLKSHERDKVALILINWYTDARKPISIFSARSIVNTVCCLLDDPEAGVNYLVREIAQYG